MKHLKIITTVIALFLAIIVQAQVVVHVNAGAPPPWGPSGYSNVRYYYLPDVESYYDVQSSKFIYFNGREWIHRAYLPSRYRTYDLYDGYKVVMTDYHGNTPYIHFNEYKVKYSKGYRGNPQNNIGQKPGRKARGGHIQSGNPHSKDSGRSAGHGKMK